MPRCRLDIAEVPVSWFVLVTAALAAGVMLQPLKAAPSKEPVLPQSTCSAAEPTDFIDTVAAAARRVMPAHCAVAPDNPVSFVWPHPRGASPSQPWQLEVRRQGGPPVALLAGRRPRVTLADTLPPGSYEWQVRYLNTNGPPQNSNWRRFSIDQDLTYRNDLLGTEALIESLTKRRSDRLLPTGMSWKQATAALNHGAAGMRTGLLQRAERSLNASPPPNVDSELQAGETNAGRKAMAMLDLMKVSNHELEHVEVLAFAWRLTDDERFLKAARARVLQLAAWRVDGASGQKEQPQANRNIYLALAVAVELLGPALTPDEWRTIASVFEKRIESALAALDLLDQEPYRSFENTTIHFAMQALALVVGRPRFESADAMIRRVWPIYLAQPQAWGDGDGSNGASIAYAWYDLRHVARTAAVLVLAAGVDVMQLSQLRRIGDFLIATTTPNQDHGNAFGDGAEVPYLFSAFGRDDFRLYAELTRKPTDAWYWRLGTAEGDSPSFVHPLHLMLALRAKPVVQPKAPEPNDWFFTRSGIVAFHSDIGSKDRSSVFFRSGPYGAFNHAHADQNSFVLQHDGKDLLISSGYYPYYHSPHHAQMARATRYKNAVTFDGGIGQAEPAPNPTNPGAPVNSMDTRGMLVFGHADPGLAIASGDASAAYRGWDAQARRWHPLVENSIRSIAYFKQAGLVVVYDWLRSSKPRRWEWNYHGVEPFTRTGGALVVRNGPTKACISHHGTLGEVETTDQFEIPPEGTAVRAQYHARYTAREASKSTSMVTVIQLDCESIPVKIVDADADGSIAVTVRNRRVLFERSGNVLVQSPGTSQPTSMSR